MTRAGIGGVRIAAATALVPLLCSGCQAAPDPPAFDLPQRAADAPVGYDVVQELREMDVEPREERIYQEVARGNVPSWLRRLERVELAGDIDGRTVRIAVWAMPDYLSVGSDDDYFYVPLTPGTARRIADRIGASLPTPAMVDAAWASARVRMIPIRFPPDEHIASMRHFERHNNIVRAQRRQHGARPGAFVAGHKLDVVLVADPAGDEPGFGVFGWHQRDGTRIQPLYPFPADAPPHFSMGVRLVHPRVEVDGEPRDLPDLLRDPDVAPLLGVGAGR